MKNNTIILVPIINPYAIKLLRLHQENPELRLQQVRSQIKGHSDEAIESLDKVADMLNKDWPKVRKFAVEMELALAEFNNDLEDLDLCFSSVGIKNGVQFLLKGEYHIVNIAKNNRYALIAIVLNGGRTNNGFKH